MFIIKNYSVELFVWVNLTLIPIFKRPLWSVRALGSVDRAVCLRDSSLVSRYTTPFHLVTPSPWPLFLSSAVLSVLLGIVEYMHCFSGSAVMIRLGSIVLLFTAVRWWTDVVYEGTKQGFHTTIVQKGLRLGFILFIFSEVMFFVAFFWAFFHSSLAPAVEIGGGWPPVRSSLVFFYSGGDFIDLEESYSTVSGLRLFIPWLIPFLNTLLLLGSGAWLTYVHGIFQLKGSPALHRYFVAFPAVR